MMAVATRGRHDQADLRRLAELGMTPLHWRSPPMQTRASGTVHIVHDGASSDLFLKDLLRAITLAGRLPQLSAGDESTNARSTDRVIQLGNAGSAMKLPGGITKVLALPSLAELRGNAVAKREAWLKLRTLLQQ